MRGGYGPLRLKTRPRMMKTCFFGELCSFYYLMIERLQLAVETYPGFVGVFFFLLGACVGSFLNVCIYRLPAGMSVVRPASRCACGMPIPWYSNIPILSWFVLRGRARCCGRKFSFRYPFVELLTALGFLYSWMMFPFAQAVVAMVFFSLMVVVSFVDLDTMELSDALTVGGLVVGLLFACFLPQIHVDIAGNYPFLFFSLKSLILSIVGAIVGAGILALFKVLSEYILKRDAMGEGDIILLACIGAFCGWQGAVFAIFGGSFIGALVMMPVLFFSSISSKRGKPYSPMIPYGPWLAIGGVSYMFFFKRFVDSHFAEMASVFF